MKAWMNACSVCAAPVSLKPSPEPAGEPVIAPQLHAEIVLILAGMLLNGGQEARA
jgi:hypothetical protein